MTILNIDIVDYNTLPYSRKNSDVILGLSVAVEGGKLNFNNLAVLQLRSPVYRGHEKNLPLTI